MKIQINSREALDRLIGNDKELEASIKNTIVNEFATKYLKGVANSEIMNKAESAVKDYLRKTDYLGLVTKSSWNNFIATSKLQECIKEAVKNCIDTLVANEVKKQITELKEVLFPRIRNLIEQYTPNITQAYIDKLVKDRIKEMLDRTK